VAERRREFCRFADREFPIFLWEASELAAFMPVPAKGLDGLPTLRVLLGKGFGFPRSVPHEDMDTMTWRTIDLGSPVGWCVRRCPRAFG
jgi:hypothetical protein